jgi:integrase
MFKRGRVYYFRRREEGKDRWKSLGPDYHKALDLLDKLKSEKSESPRELGTVAEFGERWIAEVLPTRRTPAGVKDLASRWHAYIVPRLGSIQVDQVTPGDIRRCRLELEQVISPATGRKFKPETVRHCLKYLRAFFSWLEDEGYIEKSPMPSRIMPRIPDRPAERFSEEQIRKLVRLPEPYRFTLKLALATGLRWSELTSVQASDIRRDGVLIVVQSKTGRVKAIPLPPDLVKQAKGRVGRLVPFRSASSFMRTIERKTGIKGVGSRLLRHTAASVALDGGVRLDVIQAMLGHRSITTSQRYAHLNEGTVHEELRRFWRRSRSNGTPRSSRGGKGSRAS